MQNKKLTLGLLAVAITATLSGCSTTLSQSELATRLADAEAQNKELRNSLAELEASVDSRDQRIASLQKQPAGSGDLLPPSAKPGECYARAFVPPQYKPVSKTVLKREAGQRIETVPARYEWTEEKVLVQEASEKIEVVPAKYGWKEEQVLVKEATSQLVEVPATYETVTERVLVRDGYTTWKKGRGPIERIDNATGEIMCLVEVPPEYKTVSKKVLKTAAGVRKVEIPAEYRTVKRRVVIEPAKTMTVAVPAKYDLVKVRKQVAPPQERRIDIPAEYQEVTDKVLVSEGQLEWRPILCETNTSPDLIRRLQSALRDAGFNPGKIDGKYGRDTQSAMTMYQKDNGLASGQLTMETLRRLKVI